MTLTERLNRLLFQHVVKGILNTPAVTRGQHSFAALSMVHHRDCLPYLLAIKTFAYYAQPDRIIVIADPSLDSEDQHLLLRHVPFIEILEATKFRRPMLPVGGCWERLSAISKLCGESPVVQTDADTMTFSRPTEVIDGMVNNRSFVLRSEHDVEIQTLDSAAAYGKTLLKDSQHIQAVAEARFDELKNWQHYRYVRGCAGFTGFSKNALTQDMLEEFSGQMRHIHGKRWDEWGTEQVSSNLLAASSPNAFLLPHPKYCNADSLSSETIVTHYIGYARHVNRGYERRAKEAIAFINAGTGY